MSGYEPAAGDLVWIDVDPRGDYEQSVAAAALVLSPAAFQRASRFAIVCPIASRVRNLRTSVLLPAGLPVAGAVLTTHVRSIDTQARPLGYAGAAVPAAILAEARAKVSTLIGL